MSFLRISMFGKLICSKPLTPVSKPRLGLSGQQYSTTEMNKNVKDKKFSLLTWNIDGLSRLHTEERAKAAAKVIKSLKPTFVFLQEVTKENRTIFETMLPKYNALHSAPDNRYHTTILTTKSFGMTNHEVVPFEQSQMQRSLQIVEGSLGDKHTILMTTHLESLGQSSDIRKEQMNFCIHTMKKKAIENPKAVILFGGDLNIRVKEVPKVFPPGINDAFIAAGCDPNEKNTYDSVVNINCSPICGPKARYDHLYFSGPVEVVDFSLQGKQMIEECHCYASDHWAIHCVFK